jgi:hypothetical protein
MIKCFVGNIKWHIIWYKFFSQSDLHFGTDEVHTSEYNNKIWNNKEMEKRKRKKKGFECDMKV